jgi:ATP-binding cassette subfamily F protein uup
MALVLNCQSIRKAYGSRIVFDGLSLSAFDGDRIGMIGPNGAGKSTLLKVLAGEDRTDQGTVAVRKGARVVYVEQDPEFPAGLTVAQVIEAALPESLDETERLARLHEALGRGNFTKGEEQVETLSGGWQKRLAIAEALAREPDLLLLDEPTNHLDVGGIVWLEKLLLAARFASIFVSHDRYFLENVSNQVVEVNRMYTDGIFAAKGSYSHFLEKRAEYQAAQAKQREALETKVRREIEWLRRGPKARTTKAQARIDSAGRLIAELDDIASRSQSGTTQIDFTATARRTKRLVSADNLGKRVGDQWLFRNVSFTLGPGFALGLLGPNGSGKTTLLKVITGEIDSDEGTVQTADALRVVYFDQQREKLNPEVSLRRALCPEGDSVIYRGSPVHVNGWAKRFLFRTEQLELPVGSLSGGEQARVLIANLMLQPADLLILDEPTNDLDIPTLEVLEESLSDFPGALLLVTHDRYLLDRLSSVLLALDGEGEATFYADLAQWEQAQSARRSERTVAARKPAERNQPPRKKLSYMESREWEQIESRIVEAEQTLRECEARMQSPEVAGDAQLLNQAYEEFQRAQQAVDELYARWAELEAKVNA